MKMTTVATALLLGFGLISCNENQPTKTEAPAPARPKFLESLQGQTFTSSSNVNISNAPEATNSRTASLPQSMTAGPTGLPAAAAPAARANTVPPAAQQPQINYPKDARWTLYCTSMQGPDRFARSAQMKEYLTAHTKFKDWYIVHNERESTLFYGFYGVVEKKDPAAARAHHDREAILAWKNPEGQQPFVACFFTPITPPDPVAPLDWELGHAPPRSFWSVQVAAFMDNPLRKQAAVDAVKELRAKGVEAYYYHGNTISSVCIGAWPASAVKEQDTDMREAQVNQEDALLVTDVPLSNKYRNARLSTRDGQRLVSYAQRIEIADPSLNATLREYPEHCVNYEARSRTVKQADGTKKEVVSPSFLVKIPGAEAREYGEGGGLVGGGDRTIFEPFSNPNGRGAAASRQPAETQGLRGLGGGGNDVWQPRAPQR
jgi:hypothetical protein